MSPHKFIYPTLAIIALLATTGCPTTDIENKNNGDGNNKTNNFNPRPDIGLPDMNDKDTTPDVDMNAGEDMPIDMIDMGKDMATQDMGQDMNMGEDMPIDMPPIEQGCQDILKLNTTFTIDTSGVIPHYYGRAIFDGDGVWMAYVRPESAVVRDMNVYATKLNCDGSVAVPSFQVNTISNTKDLHVSIAQSDETIFIAWTKEDANNEHKLFVRTFNPDGVPLTSTAQEITPQGINNKNISKLVWETDIAGLTGNKAVVAASYFAEESGSFQIVAQRIDQMGVRLGPALFPKKDKGVDQKAPSITALLDGSIYVSYTRSKPAINGNPAIDDRVVYAKFAPNATAPDASGPFPANPSSNSKNSLSRYSKNRLTTDDLYLVFMTENENNILVKDGKFGAPFSLGEAGQNGRYDHRPSIAAKAAGGALAWFRANPSPIKNDVYVQSFTNNAGTIAMGSSRKIPLTDVAKPAGNDGPGIIHIRDNTYFVTWSEGSTSSNAKIKGRFIQF